MIGSLLVLSAAPAWALSVSPNPLDFGKIRVGHTETLDLAVTIASGFRYGDPILSVTGSAAVVLSNGTCVVGVLSPGPCVVQLSMNPSVPSVTQGHLTIQQCTTTGGGVCGAPWSTDTVSFTGEGVANAAPVCQDVSASVRTGSAVDLNLDCTDTDTDPITYAVITPPQHGSLALGIGGDLNYVPYAGYTGPDSFTYQADDGIAYPASNVATASITVRPRTAHPSPSPTPTERFVVNMSKVGKGRIVSDPVGINCGIDCTGEFDEGSQVTLTAKARAGWEFMRWRYRCKGQGKVCTIEVTSNFRAMAVFVRPPVVGAVG